MRKITSILLTAALVGVSSLVSLAQTPDATSYQAVARDAVGDIMANATIDVTFIIHSGSAAGPVVYEEDHTGTGTNQFGLFNLEIGQGTPVTGTYGGIDWSADSHWLEVEVDGNSVGAQQILAVPYTLLARNVENDAVNDADSDPTNELQTISKSGSTVTLSDGGGSFTDDDTDADADPTNELQTLSISGNNLSISSGNTVALPGGGGGSPWTESGGEVYYTGNVGIGNTNPSVDLHVTGTNELARLQSTSTSGYMTLYNSNGYKGYLWATGDNFEISTGGGSPGNLILSTEGTDRITMEPTGHTGLGTSNPSHHFDVAATTNGATRTLNIVNSASGSISQLINIERTNVPTGGNDFFQLKVPAGAPDNFQFFEAERGTTVEFRVNGDGEVYTASNIGIQTTTPATPLHIDANSELARFEASGSSGWISMHNNGGNRGHLWASGANMELGTAAGNATGEIQFALNGTDRMVIEPSGEVGIGTSSPTSPLHIAALAGVDPLRVQLAGVTRLMVHDNGGVGLGYSITTPPADGMIVSGDVGIGTSSPTNARVHIHEPSSGDANIRFTNTTTGTTGTDGCWVGFDLSETMWVWNYENTDLRFGTNSTTRMNIEPTGDIGFNTVAPSADYDFHHSVGGASEGLMLFNTGGNSNDWTFYVQNGIADLYLYANSTARGQFNDVTGVYSTISDSRFKENIQGIGSVLQKVEQLTASSYQFTSDPDGRQYVGFLAQEAEPLFPELVNHNQLDDGSEMYTMDYAGFSVIAIKAIQELKELIDVQQAEIDALKEQLAR